MSEEQLVQELKEDLWQAGNLEWKCLPHQKIFYHKASSFIIQPDVNHGLIYVANCSRRFGKTTIGCVLASEFALKCPNTHIRLAAPSAKQLKEIVHPIFRKIFADCPPYLRPEWRTADAMFLFPNGAHIHLAGCDNENLENLRGHESHLNIITEAGSIAPLEYLINSILLPQTLTTNGKTIIDSTPSPKPAHYFEILCQEALMEGNYSEFTLDDNTSIPDNIKEIYIKRAGGRDSSTCQREYYCKHVVDEQSVIVPEWKQEFVQVVQRPDMYNFYEKYVGGDLGTVHKTVFLFGYYDFAKAQLIIEREIVMSGNKMTTDKIASGIKYVESDLEWQQSVRKPSRWCDNNNLLLLNDLCNLHNLDINATSKDSFEAMRNFMRMFIGQGRLIVNPGCKELIGCLTYGIMNKKGDDFDVNPVFGHFDALSALKYLIRNLDTYTNPIPANHGLSGHRYFITEDETKTGNFAVLEKALGIEA